MGVLPLGAARAEAKVLPLTAATEAPVITAAAGVLAVEVARAVAVARAVRVVIKRDTEARRVAQGARTVPGRA